MRDREKEITAKANQKRIEKNINKIGSLEARLSELEAKVELLSKPKPKPRAKRKT